LGKETTSSKNKKLKILIAASEAVPFAKTGGLADVAGALPKALKKAGHDVRLVMPRYKSIDEDKCGIKINDTGKTVEVDIALFKHVGAIRESTLPGTDIPVYFIDCGEFFYRDELYRTPQGEYYDNPERFMFFSRAIVEMVKRLGWIPDVINCNDWHTGLVPAYIKTIYAWDSIYKDIATVYSVHNLAYQGYCDKEKIIHAGFNWGMYTPDKMEFYGGMNFMKTGIVYADVVNTVSENYKKESETLQFGYNLEGVLKSRNPDYHGVVNGIDYDIWDPAHDKFLTVNYDINSIQLKEGVKKKLLEDSGLKYVENVPLLGMVSRLDWQKGLDFVAAIIDDLMRLNIQFVVLGTGEQGYHDMLYNHMKSFPQKMAVHLKFDNRLAHEIYAGADMFLMPSNFEPCGLSQLISLRYGTVPVVRATGGLVDTVQQYNFKTKQGTGFLFPGYYPGDFLQAIRIACDTYKNKTTWGRIVENGMKQNFSWDRAAEDYVGLYKEAIEKRRKIRF
jgi:starch synthase